MEELIILIDKLIEETSNQINEQSNMINTLYHRKEYECMMPRILELKELKIEIRVYDHIKKLIGNIQNDNTKKETQ